MSGINLRKRARISYYEPEEPSLDEFIFCDECSDYVYEYCSLHGPLLILPDDKVSTKSSVPRANLSLPHVFLEIAPSSIPGAGLGVFSKLTLPKDIQFGPYIGRKNDNIDTTTYCWQIYKDGKQTYSVDAADVNKSNWMRYVNCARHFYEQNLLAYQYKGEIYYRTIRIIPRNTELLVFYGSEYAITLGINLQLYNKSRAIALKDHKKKEKECNAKSMIRNQENGASTSSDVNNNLVRNPIQSPTKSIVDTQKKSFKPPFKNDKLNIKINDKTFICDVCKKVFDEKLKLEEHIGIHFKTNIKRNDIMLRNKSVHIRKVEKLYACKTQKNGKKTQHTGKKPYKCEICSYETTHMGNLKTHMRIHTGEKPYKCEICSYETTRLSDLKRHMFKHTGEKPYKCEICSYETTQKGTLKIHMFKHTGEKPYKCEICSHKTAHLGHLKTHMLRHTGEKPYKCEICSYETTRLSDLKIHMFKHTGEKPYKCEICSYETTQKGTLKIHMFKHTGEKPYKCEICSHKTAHLGHLKTHMLQHTGEKPYKCEICSYDTTQMSNLKTHMRKHLK